jgi:hypothetical protein
LLLRRDGEVGGVAEGVPDTREQKSIENDLVLFMYINFQPLQRKLDLWMLTLSEPWIQSSVKIVGNTAEMNY